MSDHQVKRHELLQQQLAELSLAQIVADSRGTFDEGASRNSSVLEVLSSLVSSEITVRRQLALQRRILPAKLPKLKRLAEHEFEFPKKITKQKVSRRLDCDFIEQHRLVVLVGSTGAGNTEFLAACGYAACERGIRTLRKPLLEPTST